MSLITLEAIQEKQAELTSMIQRLQDQAASGTQIEIEGRTIVLQVGERYAGAKLDANGNFLHDVIVMTPGPTKKQDFDGVQAWAKAVGGDAPSPEEFALIKANCGDLLTESWYWTNKPYAENASHAWYFRSDGSTGIGYKSAAGGALSVRRA